MTSLAFPALDQARSKGACVAMLGARRHYAVPRLLHETGLLGRFCTDGFGR